MSYKNICKQSVLVKPVRVLLHKRTQQSVHWTLGSLRDLQAFSGFEFFLLPSIVHARPSASNANRWAAGKCLYTNEIQMSATNEN